MCVYIYINLPTKTIIFPYLNQFLDFLSSIFYFKGLSNGSLLVQRISMLVRLEILAFKNQTLLSIISSLLSVYRLIIFVAYISYITF